MATDYQGAGCSFYDANPWACGWHDDHDFHAATVCCACGGGEGQGNHPFQHARLCMTIVMQQGNRLRMCDSVAIRVAGSVVN